MKHLSVTEAARRLGWNAESVRRALRSGRFTGSFRDSRGRWHVPEGEVGVVRGNESVVRLAAQWLTMVPATDANAPGARSALARMSLTDGQVEELIRAWLAAGVGKFRDGKRHNATEPVT